MWQVMDIMPQEVAKGIAKARSGSFESAAGLLFEEGVDTKDFQNYFNSLLKSDPGIEDDKLYAQLIATYDPKAYLPKQVPLECRWAESRWGALGKTEKGVTLRSEIACELDEWEVNDRDLRREQALYFEALDQAVAAYRLKVEAVLQDSRDK